MLAQQFGGGADLIVKVDQPGAGLGRVPRQRKLAPQFERGGQPVGQFEHRPVLSYNHKTDQQRGGRIQKTLFELDKVLTVAGQLVGRKQQVIKRVEGSQSCFWTGC